MRGMPELPELGPALRDYVDRVGVREHPALSRLRDENRSHPRGRFSERPPAVMWESALSGPSIAPPVASSAASTGFT